MSAVDFINIDFGLIGTSKEIVQLVLSLPFIPRVCNFLGIRPHAHGHEPEPHRPQRLWHATGYGAHPTHRFLPHLVKRIDFNQLRRTLEALV